MRKIAGTLIGFFLTNTLLLAQQPQPVVQQPQQADPKLEAALAGWEKAMSGTNTFHLECSRVNLDKTWNTSEVYEGVARYQKPNKGLLYLAHKTKKDLFEKLVINDQTLLIWDPKTKTVQIHQLPPAKNGKVSDDSFLSFMFGMKAKEAKDRFQMKLLPAPPNDTFYTYIEILPLQQDDKQAFSRARLVLTNSTGLPRQLWFQQPNGSEVTWDFGKILTNVQLPQQDFQQPTQLEQGWQFQRVQPNQPNGPRVVRPKG